YTISGAVLTSLRGYFRGVTVVAAFNGVVVGLAALLLDVPLAGTIAVVSFVTAYVPYLGAVVAGTFAVLVALGAQGTGVAIAMLVVVLLANGLLQNLVQPFAMGSALHLNPLVVLVVTIGAGGAPGLSGIPGDLHGALEDVNVPAYAVDRFGVIRWINSAAKKLVGDVRGKQQSSVVVPEQAREAKESFLRKMMGTEESTDGTVVVVGPDGERVQVEIRSCARRAAHRLVGASG